MPLSKKLAELMGGTLAIHSELGVGTTVEVTLPMDRAKADIDTPDKGNPVFAVAC